MRATAMLLALLLSLSLCADHVSSLSASPSIASVEVFDSVFSSDASYLLHRHTSSQPGTQHTFFDRRALHDSTSEGGVVERAIDSYLTERGDDAPLVEWWCRQDWRHIHAHADVDEGLAKTDPSATHRHPRHGHVLYLDVGSLVRGPTCLWSAESEMVVVPPQQGRVLRFDGRLVHAVPRPHDAWLLPFVREEPSTDEHRRSVVLFNTWADADRPPLNVSEATASEVAPSGDLLHVDDARAQPNASWAIKTVEAWTDPGGPAVRLKVPLLGNSKRRGGVERFRQLAAPSDMAAALAEPERVWAVQLAPWGQRSDL